VQGEDEPHHSTGVYSIVKNQWIVEPKKIKPQVDDAAVEAKKDSVMHDIETAMLSKNLINYVQSRKRSPRCVKRV